MPFLFLPFPVVSYNMNIMEKWNLFYQRVIEANIEEEPEP